MSGGDNDPLIVTAELPKELAGWATGLRRQHFPPERNYLDAHVTLFHALPRQYEREVRDCLSDIARETPPVDGHLEGIMSLGRGTALRLHSEGMIAVWREMTRRFHGLLTAQDQHKPRLHVTIQNKVSGAEAKALQAQLEGTIEPRDFQFRGLSLYIYRGGPWEFLHTYAFRGKR
ncbi:2'-5' RNA ligase family protein [Erythrobacter sp. HKB08]|uniref:2'-5' RNA ligase family protein n=1 Tax=Erythrobacter sp. HKB08 TaxID=2502843 RepID=UPI001008A086|nr:2'-5' RNA ligase family protein [Erythrobacter sp. HKB08]